MNKLSKEKRSQLALTVVIILLVATGLYSGLIRFQQAKLRNLDLEKQKANKKLSQINETSRSSAKIEAELKESIKELDIRESDMVSNDLYASMINSIRTFKLPYQVEIKQFNSKGLTEMNLFPKYPYKQYTVSLVGSAYYHDLGRFIADFENRFRSSRILNLDLAPESTQDKEKLVFRMDIVSLVKPSGSSLQRKQ
jgi:Tfp pilus assembly protein PilO